MPSPVPPNCPWCDFRISPDVCSLCGGKLKGVWDADTPRACTNCGQTGKPFSIQIHDGRQWHSGCWEDHQMDVRESFEMGPDGDG